MDRLRSAGRVALVGAALALAAGTAVLVQTAGGADFGGQSRVDGSGTLLTVADLDGANGLDLVSRSPDAPNAVDVFLRRADGSYAAQPEIANVNDEAAAVADLGGDGRRDLALLGTSGSADVRVTGGSTTNVATPAGAAEDPALGDEFRNGAAQAVTGDLAGGAPTDLLVATSGGGALFTGPVGATSTAIPDLSRIGIPTRLALANLDGDGLLDVVAGGSKGAIVLLSTKGFKNTTRLQTARVRDLTLGNFDADGITDMVVVTGGSSPHVALRSGLGGGAFEAVEQVLAAPANPVLVGEGDVDRQGGPDLVVVNGESDGTGGVDTFALLAGHGDGTFDPPAPLAFVTEDPLHVRRLFVTDVDGDGADDVVFGNDALDGSSIATNKSLRPAGTTPAGATGTPGGPVPSTAERPSETSVVSVETTTTTSRGDVTPPSLRVLGAPRRVAPGGAILLRVACDEPCTVTATGRVSIPVAVSSTGSRSAARRTRSIALPRATATAARGRTATVRVVVPRRALAVVRRAIAAGARPVAVIRLAARDAAGNPSAARTLTVRIGPARAARRV